MHLFFMRHGEAGHTAPTDFERELTGEGETASLNAGTFFSDSNIHFTHVLCSPLVRARQTADCVLQQHPDIRIELTEYLTPDSDPRNLLEHLRSFSSDSRLLLVTHEPFVSDCISILISGTESVNIVMRPATITLIETNGTPGRGNGQLRWILPPQVIEKLK